MSHWRVRAKLMGGHWHVRFFVASEEGMTHAGCGELVMDDDDWRSLRGLLNVEPPFNAHTADDGTSEIVIIEDTREMVQHGKEPE